MKKLMAVLMVASLLLCAGIAFNAWAAFGDQSDAPADHGADDESEFDVVDTDTDSADENTEVADVYPAGSENSVIVDEPVR